MPLEIKVALPHLNGNCQECLPLDCLQVGNSEVGIFKLTHHQKCLPYILDILTCIFKFLLLFDVNVLESVCKLLSNLVWYVWDKLNISKRVDTTSTVTSANALSLYPTSVFFDVKVVAWCSKLFRCIYVSLYLPFFWFTEFQNPTYIFVFSKSCNFGPLECLKSHCKFVCSGL